MVGEERKCGTLHAAIFNTQVQNLLKRQRQRDYKGPPRDGPTRTAATGRRNALLQGIQGADSLAQPVVFPAMPRPHLFALLSTLSRNDTHLRVKILVVIFAL